MDIEKLRRLRIPSRKYQQQIIDSKDGPKNEVLRAMKSEFAKTINQTANLFGWTVAEGSLSSLWDRLRGFSIHQIGEACEWYERQDGQKWFNEFYAKLRRRLVSVHGDPRRPGISVMGVVGGKSISYTAEELERKKIEQGRFMEHKKKVSGDVQKRIEEAKSKSVRELAVESVKSVPKNESLQTAAAEQRQRLRHRMEGNDDGVTE